MAVRFGDGSLLALTAAALVGCAHGTPPLQSGLPLEPVAVSLPGASMAHGHPVATPEPRPRLPQTAPPEAATNTGIPTQWQMPQSGSDVHIFRPPHARGHRHRHHHHHYGHHHYGHHHYGHHHYDPAVGAIVADLAFLAILTAALSHHH